MPPATRRAPCATALSICSCSRSAAVNAAVDGYSFAHVAYAKTTTDRAVKARRIVIELLLAAVEEPSEDAVSGSRLPLSTSACTESTVT